MLAIYFLLSLFFVFCLSGNMSLSQWQEQEPQYFQYGEANNIPQWMLVEEYISG